MKCPKKGKKLIQMSLDGDIGAADRKLLDEHLKACESCRAYLEQMESIKKLAGIRKLEGRSKSYWRSYWPRLKPRLTEKRMRRSLPVGRLIKNPAFDLAVVAVIVLIVLVQFNRGIFESRAVRTEPIKISAQLRSPEAYRHVLESVSSPAAETEGRMDRVVYPGQPIEHVLAPAYGVKGTTWSQTLAI